MAVVNGGGITGNGNKNQVSSIASGLSGNKMRLDMGEFNFYYKICSQNWLMRFWMLPILLFFHF